LWVRWANHPWFDLRTTRSSISEPPQFGVRTTLSRRLAARAHGHIVRVVADEPQGIARGGLVAGDGLRLIRADQAPLLQPAQGGRQRAPALDAAAAVEHLALARHDPVQELRVADAVRVFLKPEGAPHDVEQRKQFGVGEDVDPLLEDLVGGGGGRRSGEGHHAPPVAPWRRERSARSRQ